MSVSNLQNLIKRLLIKKGINFYQTVQNRTLNTPLQIKLQSTVQRDPSKHDVQIGYFSQHHEYQKSSDRNILTIISASIFTWLGFSSEEEEEDEMIMTIKRSILCIQRDELAKAEQMLHLALRLAQQKQNALGVTYIYDIMANLALDRGELDKAEKLFVMVMQQLLQQGTSQDDLKMLHISLKLARIFFLRKEMDKAELGFEWALKGLSKHVTALKETDNDVLGLWGMARYWFGHFQIEKGNYADANDHLLAAYNTYVTLHGTDTEQAAVLLNDLGALNSHTGNLNEAERYLKDAADLGNKLPEMEEIGSIYANLGIVFIKQGLYEEARNACAKAWRLGAGNKNVEIQSQATYCLDELKKALK